MPAVEPRERQVRRATVLLTLAQALLWGALGVWAAVAPVQIDEITGRQRFAGVLVTIYYVAAGLGARGAGRLMDRAGRRPGLMAGYAIFGLGGLGSFLSVRANSGAGLLASTFLVGAGAAAALLGRAAVADMHPPERRGRAIGLLVLAGTAGAVGGPFLAAGIRRGGEALPWLAVAALCALALGCVAGLRPDPRQLAVGGGPSRGPGRAAGVLRARPVRAAAVAIGVSQAVMATFMAVVPVVLNREHAGHATVSLVVALHLGAMFAFSPAIGAALDRWGRRRGMLAGLIVTAAGVGLCAFLGVRWGSTVGLFLIGVGWSAAYLGSTAAVSDLAGPAERASALGTVDLISGLSAAAGVLGGAALLEVAGIASLGGAALVAMLAPFVLVVLLREPAPGRWDARPDAA